MKKGITILLLLSIFIEVAGYRMFFSVWEQQVRLSMKSNMRKNLFGEHVESFAFTADEWGKMAGEEDEFTFNGRMYDIVESHLENNRVLVTCISDEKETSLVNRYNSFSHSIFGREGTKKAALLLKMVSNPYVRPQGLEISSLYFEHREHLPGSASLIFSSSSEVLTPPPQTA